MKTRCQWVRTCSKLNAFRRDLTCHKTYIAYNLLEIQLAHSSSKPKGSLAVNVQKFVHTFLCIQFRQPLALKAVPCTQACLTWEYLTRHCLLTCFSKKNRCLHVRDATTYAKCAKPSCKLQSMQAKSPIQNNQYSRTHKSKQRIYIYILYTSHDAEKTR